MQRDDLSDIRTSLAELQRATGRIEGRLEEFGELNLRVRKLENKQHFYSGIAAVIGSLVTIFVKPHLG
jgi:hypothetical protein